MADTPLQVVVSPFLGVLYDNLASLIQKQFGLIWGVPKEMEKLSSTLSTIQNVIQDAEDKQLTNKAIVDWLRKLKDAAYDADDVLDECAFEGLQLASDMANSSWTKQVTNSLKQVALRRKIAKRIKRLIERFDKIAEERSKFHFSEGIVERKVEFSRDRETSSKLTEPQFYGRDEDKENLVTLLLKNVSSQEDISVCPVVGIGGIGKTTLTQMVYNDERIANHFDVKAWVCVYDDFDVKRLIKSIIVSLSGGACDLEELDHLQCRLQERLTGKRFLLVLDNVWHENQEDWNKLKYSLSGGAKGSSVIVTTRLETVAAITGTVEAYRLKVLSEDDCWSLFKQRAFGPGNEERPDLVKIGKEIVKKCGGIPLAAKALGGLMRFKREQREWLFVRDSKIWDLPQNSENNILPAPRLSYNHLPSHLRQCFAFCSIYPKDHIIKKKELVQLWIANGLVHAKERMELEDVANQIFNDLLWRSLFQEAKTNEGGNIFECKIHDLVHDLVCSITLNECSFVEDGKIESVDKRIRHLSLNLRSFPVSLPKVPPHLRTILLMNGSYVSKVPRLDFSNLVCLRVLDLSHTEIKTFPIPTSNLKHLRYLNLSDTKITALPIQTSNLKHLRYLNLSNTKITALPIQMGNLKHLRFLNLCSTYITALPESLCSLQNLEVLNLEFCRELKMLPKHMGKMSSLIHLYIRGCRQLIHMPLGMGQLVHLQTLSFYIVGLETGRHIEELKQLDLSGELSLNGLELVRNSMDAREAKLIEKKNLQSLHLTWSNSGLQEHAAEVIEGLHPHPNITSLSITKYGGVNFPSWLGVSSSVPKLVRLHLWDCSRIESLPSFGQLPLLKNLWMDGMSCLKSIGSEFYSEGESFPSLEELKVCNMPELEEWHSLAENGREMVMLSVLKKLIIRMCPKLTKVPFPLSIKNLTISNCNEMVLRLLQNLPSLSSLRVSSFDELTSFREGVLRNCTALHSLEIVGCSKLQSLPMEMKNLTSLTSLAIANCEELSCFPEELQNLTSLELYNCNGVKSLPFLRSCRSLRNMRIKHCGNLISLSEGLQHLTTLESLRIEYCGKLEFSPEDFQQLISLRILNLRSLPQLTSLPRGLHPVSTLKALWISGCSGLKLELIPEEIQRLTALRILMIEGCSDQLKRRCEKDKGEDWHKIRHIPQVMIESSHQEEERQGLDK